MSDLERIDAIMDTSDPFAVINLVPSSVANQIRVIPEDVLCLTMKELEEKAGVDETARKLRIAFWLEYERACRTKSPMNMANVHKGVLTPLNFTRHFITNSFRLAYMLTPLEDYRIQMEEMLLVALKAEREILQMPIKAVRKIIKNGEEKEIEFTDSALAMVQHRIRESIQNRLQGMPVHRSMQITTHQHVNHNQAIPGAFDISPEDLKGKSTTELNDLIKKLRDQHTGDSRPGLQASREAESQDPVIEVQSKPVK